MIAGYRVGLKQAQRSLDWRIESWNTSYPGLLKRNVCMCRRVLGSAVVFLLEASVRSFTWRSKVFRSTFVAIYIFTSVRRSGLCSGAVFRGVGVAGQIQRTIDPKPTIRNIEL